MASATAFCTVVTARCAFGVLLTLIGVFLAFSTIGEVGVIFIGFLADHFSENVSLLLFFVLWAVVVTTAWPLALWATSKDAAQQFYSA
jgi:NADH:ubiquinone oxidoreductase subunit 2 (subunit N)